MLKVIDLTKTKKIQQVNELPNQMATENTDINARLSSNSDRP
jgi:hypothetical protein